MNFVPLLFLIIEFALIAIGALIGYRRGLIKSLVRLVYLVIIGVISFFVGRAIAFPCAGKICKLIIPMLPDEALEIVKRSFHLETLASNILGGLFSAITFAVIFALLRLLSLIYFNKLSGWIAKKLGEKDPLSTASKWWGVAIGFIYSTLAAAILLLPIFTPLYILDSIPDQTINVYYEAIEENYSDQPNYEETKKLLTETKPSISVTKFFPFSRIISDTATSYNIPKTDVSDSITHAVPAFVELGSDTLHVYNNTVYNEEHSTVVLNNTAAAVTLHLENSPTIKQTSAYVISAISQILLSDGEFMDIQLPTTDNVIVDFAIASELTQIAQTDFNTVKTTMIQLFGFFDPKLLPEHKRYDIDVYFPNSEYTQKEQKGLVLMILNQEYAHIINNITNIDINEIINGIYSTAYNNTIY